MHPLERLAADAMIQGGLHPCRTGHQWRHIGGKSCGCRDGEGHCSVPVHSCVVCGDSDYGDNEEAREKIAACAASYVPEVEDFYDE